MEVTVNLKWEEDSGTEIIYRPDWVAVKLYRDGNAYDEVLSENLYESNNWSYTWKGLPDGDYSVDEIYTNEKYFERAVVDEISEEGTFNVRKKTITLKKSLKSGSIAVYMKVSGNAAEKDRAWKFKITGLGNHAYPYTRYKYGKLAQNGELYNGFTFTLEHGESISISEIPLVSICKISWEENSDGYDTTCVVTGACMFKAFEEKQGCVYVNCVNPAQDKVSVEVIKHKEENPDVEPKSSWKKFLLPLGIFCFGQLLSAAIRKNEKIL